MKNFKETYNKEFKKELEQFLLLCSNEDARLLLTQSEKAYSSEYLRLTCICLAFGYKKIFLKIFTLAQNNINRFFNDLDSLNGNFKKVDEWITEFINNIGITEAQETARRFWQERKETIDCANFTIKNLLQNSP